MNAKDLLPRLSKGSKICIEVAWRWRLIPESDQICQIGKERGQTVFPFEKVGMTSALVG